MHTARLFLAAVAGLGVLGLAASAGAQPRMVTLLNSVVVPAGTTVLPPIPLNGFKTVSLLGTLTVLDAALDLKISFADQPGTTLDLVAKSAPIECLVTFSGIAACQSGGAPLGGSAIQVQGPYLIGSVSGWAGPPGELVVTLKAWLTR
jgi:hypothetical protein